MRYLMRAQRRRLFAGLDEISRRPLERRPGIMQMEPVFGNDYNIPNK